MSFFKKAREVTDDLAAASKRQAQRGKLEIEIRRLEGKINDEKHAIGEALYPLLESGQLTVEVESVHESMKRIAELTSEVGQRRAEIDALREGGEEQAPPEAPPPDGQVTPPAPPQA